MGKGGVSYGFMITNLLTLHEFGREKTIYKNIYIMKEKYTTNINMMEHLRDQLA